MATGVVSSGHSRGDRPADVTTVVRTFALVYNAVASYGADHPVVLRTIQEQMPALEQVLGEFQELTFVFGNQQVLWNDTPIEPGNTLFQRFAQLFTAKGVSAITVLAGLTAEELRQFCGLLKRSADQVPVVGLAVLLERQGLRSIREVKLERAVHRAASGESGDAGMGGSAANASLGGRTSAHTHPVSGTKTVVTDTARSPMGGLTSSATGAGRATVRVPQPAMGSKPMAAKTSGGGSGSGGRGSDIAAFQEFVQDVLQEVSWRVTPPDVGAERIAAQYSQRLNQKVEEVRQQTVRQIRCLENIRDVMLTELDNLKVPAILLDGNQGIVEMNAAARPLVGGGTKVEPGSPLHAFLVSGKERGLVDIGGSRRTAHRILSTGGDSNAAVILLALE
jgi:hypothetical protein